ncbi:MAG: bifunctional phosphoribosylaminoimidazolecarboxamide formyltransferase/IMP cyclohydrolase [Bacteroidales bacterium]|nr:bifunctional phosphoribosylaminoimidazolecarboxamide formyltransferase/IMP cyclohydrolase [Bacteroidales bacterium]
MRALVSVSDKSGLVPFVSALKGEGWEIIATGGTRRMLEDAGIATTGISDVTGFPEICDGRVKTLHPKVHGALLARRDVPAHMKALEDNGIGLIDLVCVNLYPFARTIASPGVSMEDAIENIDIGGPSMLRSAAKNWNDVTVVCDPEDYDAVIAEIRSQGNTSRETRLRLSAKAYTHTAEYDCCIATYMRTQAGLNPKLFLEYELKQPLRYGENPHQQAAFYAAAEPGSFSLAGAVQIQGKELSYNNIQDANAALNVVRDFDAPFCVALKHMNPCGAAVGSTIEEAWQAAYEADKVSIYGGIVAVNRELTEAVAEGMKPIFLEIVIAPSFTPGALEILSSKKNLRVLKVDMTKSSAPVQQIVGVNGGVLVQQLDTAVESIDLSQCVTKLKPSESLLSELDFGWKIVKHVKSNAIAVVKDGHTVGVGAGQTNRVGSAKIALEEARAAGFTSGLVLASDGFLPFADTVELAASYGVAAIVQPGGSIRDEESVAKADELGISMIFTGVRHFKH